MEERKRYLLWDFHIKVTLEEANKNAVIFDYNFDNKVRLKIPLSLKDADFVEKELNKGDFFWKRINSIYNEEDMGWKFDITQEQEDILNKVLDYFYDDLKMEIGLDYVIELLYKFPESKDAKADNVNYYITFWMTD